MIPEISRAPWLLVQQLGRSSSCPWLNSCLAPTRFSTFVHFCFGRPGSLTAEPTCHNVPSIDEVDDSLVGLRGKLVLLYVMIPDISMSNFHPIPNRNIAWRAACAKKYNKYSVLTIRMGRKVGLINTTHEKAILLFDSNASQYNTQNQIIRNKQPLWIHVNSAEHLWNKLPNIAQPFCWRQSRSWFTNLWQRKGILNSCHFNVKSGRLFWDSAASSGWTRNMANHSAETHPQWVWRDPLNYRSTSSQPVS